MTYQRKFSLLFEHSGEMILNKHKLSILIHYTHEPLSMKMVGSDKREAKARATLRYRTDSPDPQLLGHIKDGSRWWLRSDLDV